MPISELLDRLSILNLKIEKSGSKRLSQERDAILQALQEYTAEGHVIDPSWLAGLEDINRRIWTLEASLSHGKDGKIPLDKIGEISLQIREYNREKIALKNRIVASTKTGFLEEKTYHASAENRTPP